MKSLTLQAFLDFSIYRKLLSFKSKCPVKHDRCEKDFCSSTKNSLPISDACASTRSAAKDFDISFASYSGLTGEKQASRSIFNLLRSVSFFNVQGNVIVTRDLTEIQCGIRESLSGYGIWPKYRAGFGKRYRDTRFGCYPSSGIL